jgi:hypothetical protein
MKAEEHADEPLEESQDTLPAAHGQSARRPILIPFIGIRNPSGDALPRSIPRITPS